VSFTAVPKPARADRILAKAEQQEKRRMRLSRLSRQKQRTSYGTDRTAPVQETWPQFKRRILARDGHRCLFRCGTQNVGVTVHHWPRTVGAGQKNDEWACLALCSACHDDAHSGRLHKQAIALRMDEHYCYPELTAWLEEDKGGER
jgi:5-methylcytosine-specific restriction endonuclease McrA